MATRNWSVRVRMFQVGFGDCFVVTFNGRTPRHMLVDFGAHGGRHRPLADVAADIRETVGNHIDVAVATHAHRDHVDGFRDVGWLRGITVGAVWLPWTEDLENPVAVELRDHVRRLAQALTQRSRRFQGVPVSDDSAVGLRGHAFDLWNAEATAANARAMDHLRSGLGPRGKVRYLRRGDAPATGIAGLKVRALGPPEETSALTRLMPPREQDWPLAMRGSAGPASSTPTQTSATVDPRFLAASRFDLPWAVPGHPDPNRLDPEWRAAVDSRIQELADAALDEGALAAALDSAINNTSVVLLMEFKGRRLLFPGDAQWGSWEAWMTGPDVTHVKNLSFLKLSHHGSHNGTPQDAVALLARRGLRTMVSTQDGVHNRVPRPSLLSALGKATGVEVIRSDLATERGPHALPEGTEVGRTWIDCFL